MIKSEIEKHITDKEAEELWYSEDVLAKSTYAKIKDIHRMKFERLRELQKDTLGIKINKNWFINKTNIDVPEEVQWVLSLGKKHALPVNKHEFPMLKFITDGEDFIQTVQDREEQEMARTKFTSIIDNHVNKIQINDRDKYTMNAVGKVEKFLRKNKNILIVNADKGNITVAMEKDDYDTKMKNIINDMMTYQRCKKDPTTILQRKNNELVEELFSTKVISEIERRKLKTDVAVAPRIYGLPKIHKEDYPLRPICSNINAPSGELCKYITTILKRITENSVYNVKDSVQFRNRIKDLTISDDEKLISFDVVSLFPSVPVDLALRIIEDRWEDIATHTNMTKDLFLRILRFCIKDNRYFKFRDKIYTQKRGLPMGSPASPIVADIVMEKLLDTSIGKLKFKPKFLSKYVDDLFGIVRESAIKEILTSLNDFHPSIKFTMEEECNKKLPYLDTIVIRRNGTIKIDWYQKPTASSRIINFYSKHPKRIIINTANNLIRRVLTISDIEFHKNNFKKIRKILSDNNFPTNLINKLIFDYEKYKTKNLDVELQPKIYKSLIFVPGLSERFEKSKLFNIEMYAMAHKSNNTLAKLYSKTKDKIEKLDKSNLIYKIPCNGNEFGVCDKVYIGTTKNKLKTRISAHKSDLKLQNKISTQKTALLAHCAQTRHSPDFDNVQVLQSENNYKRRFTLEMLHIIKTTTRMNFKADVDENSARVYRHLVNKRT